MKTLCAKGGLPAVPATKTTGKWSENPFQKNRVSPKTIEAGKTFLTAMLVVAMFSACGNDEKDDSLPESKTYDAGVVINAITWATRNVDAFGAFAAKPESNGRVYKWNEKTAWNVDSLIKIYGRGGVIPNWDVSAPTSSVWEDVNCPCPQGWRLPTSVELQSLVDAGYVLTTINGQAGFRFGTEPNTLFLPTFAFINGDNKQISNVNFLISDYWSGDTLIDGKAKFLICRDNYDNENGYIANVHTGYNVNGTAFYTRCVKK